MRKTVNVKIGDTNPAQKFDTDIPVADGDRVIVETLNGSEWGVISGEAHEVKNRGTENNLILRIANAADNKVIDKLVTSAAYAIKVVRERIEKYNLEMKLLSAHYTFDSSKIIVQFYSENRVDFRELVKDLAYSLRARIELHQVGARDEVKIVGAMGQCGQPCCCARFLDEFDNITIKMAKNQNISLNPQKINGMCGRLLCCLSYENDHYAEMQEKIPKYGSEIITPDGKGFAQDNNMLKETVNVKFVNGDISTFKCYKLCDLKCKNGGSCPHKDDRRNDRRQNNNSENNSK